LLEKYYRPHHAKLTSHVGTVLKHHSKALIIDCHSFPARPLPYEFDQTEVRPDICIGTDDFHTQSWIVDQLVTAFKAEDLRCEINTPFGGALVPLQYFRKERSVSSIMVEVNRSLYMDEKSGEKGVRFTAKCNAINRVLSELIAAFHLSKI